MSESTSNVNKRLRLIENLQEQGYSGAQATAYALLMLVELQANVSDQRLKEHKELIAAMDRQTEALKELRNGMAILTNTLAP